MARTSKMNKFLILFVAFIYLIVGVKYLSDGQLGQGVIWVAYCFANVGFCLI